MRAVGQFVKVTLVGGLLVLAPLCLVVMLLVKAFSAVLAVVHPVAARLPTGVRFANLVSLLLIVGACFIVGMLVRTRTGRQVGAFMDRRVLGRVPGYSLLHADGKYTVFVPAVPTPGVGAVYVLPRERVHIVDVPFNRMVSCVSNWGTNLRDLVPSIRRS